MGLGFLVHSTVAQGVALHLPGKVIYELLLGLILGVQVADPLIEILDVLADMIEGNSDELLMDSRMMIRFLGLFLCE